MAGLVAAADWPRLRHALLDGDIFWDQFPDILTTAARNTLIFTGLSFAIGLGLAVLLAVMRLSPLRPYRWFAATWIEVFRGLPALTTIFVVGYGLPIALGWRVPGTYGPGSVALGVVYSAYMAETIRAGIEAVPRGQVEAARSLGMSGPTAMTAVVMPQAFRIVVPPLTNELVALIKDTSLLSMLGTTAATIEVTQFARDASVRQFNLTPVVAAALVYLVITIPMTRAVALLERRNRRAR